MHIYNENNCDYCAQDNLSKFNEATMNNMEALSCWLMDPVLAEKMYLTNLVIAISYGTIATCLLLLAGVYMKLFSWKFKLYLGLFATFILACGVGHYIKVMNIWWGDFELELLSDRITAIASGVTALTTIAGILYMFRRTRDKKDILPKLKDLLIVIGLMFLKKPNLRDKFETISDDLITYDELSKADKGVWNTLGPGILSKFEGNHNGILVFTAAMEDGAEFKRHAHDCWEMCRVDHGVLICPLKGGREYGIGEVCSFGLTESHEPVAKGKTILKVFFAKTPFTHSLINLVNNYAYETIENMD